MVLPVPTGQSTAGAVKGKSKYIIPWLSGERKRFYEKKKRIKRSDREISEWD